MTHRDYLWCLLHLRLDEEEEAALLCPACRAAAELPRCPHCGTPTDTWESSHNETFDLERFATLQKGETP